MAVVANVETAVVGVDDGSSVVAVDGDGAAENLIPEAHHPVSFSLVH